MTVRTCMGRLVGTSATRRNALGAAALLLISAVGLQTGGLLTGLSFGPDPADQSSLSRPADDISRPKVVRPVTAGHLETLLKQADFDIKAVRAKTASVPRLYVRQLPKDLVEVKDTARRKNLFFGALLPLILMANEELRADRAQVEALRSRYTTASGPGDFTGTDRWWLQAVFTRYGVDFGDWDGLLLRLDEIPVSLIMAQAIQESGWGTSRFAREGNALFGQRTWDPEDAGIVPDLRAEGESYRVKSFPDLMAAVRSYMLNLNTHKAYGELRARRAELRQTASAGDPGRTLATSLTRYSEESGGYVKALKALIRDNDLTSLNPARLGSSPNLMASRSDGDS